ncbi:MAG: class I SAM-dependent methyltransferase [Rickettsiales bacterium]|nr:class I SAM-dependent methyltransferase [Rickettsiales bacterium]
MKFKFFISNGIVIVCLALIVINNVTVRMEIKDLSKLLSTKIDILEDSMIVLNSDVDEPLVPPISPHGLWKEFGITTQEDIAPDSFAASFATHAEKKLIASISRSSNNILEIGTGKGGTTLLMAKYSAPKANIYTIDLPKDAKAILYEHGDSPTHAACAIKARKSTNYIYNKTKYNKKIHQVFTDTKSFDETPLSNQIDFIFIDGAKTYSYIKNDTQKALKMIKPNGVVLWRSYDKKSPDVMRFLNELSQNYKIYKVQGTSLVIYRAV